MKVLCVDDNDIHLYSISRLLQHAGYEVTGATSGNEAIGKAVDESPDVVLLDINLPDVNGYEVCARLKADSRTASLPVIFYTAQASSMAKTHAELVGAAAFFTYPVSLDQVKTAIQAAVTKAAKARGAL
jgi:CheY-like chemotaxis protein